jgi:hypothetical protein
MGGVREGRGVKLFSIKKIKVVPAKEARRREIIFRTDGLTGRRLPLSKASKTRLVGRPKRRSSKRENLSLQVVEKRGSDGV